MSNFATELQDEIKLANEILAHGNELSEDQLYTLLLASLLEEESNE